MAIHNNATTNHLQWHNLHLVYSIIDNIVKFQDFILITFSATYLTIIHHNCAFIHHFIWADCCVSMIHCSSIHCTNSVYSLSIQSDGWLLCLWCYLAINLPQLIHIISHFPPVLMLCLLLHLRVDCCIDAPPAAPIHRRVDCCVSGCSSTCTAPPAHLLCTSWLRCTRDMHSHQTIATVLMAETAAVGRSPAAAKVSDGVGWV